MTVRHPGPTGPSAGAKSTIRRIVAAAVVTLAVLAPAVPVATAPAAAASRALDWRGDLATVTRFLETPGGLTADNCAATINRFADRLEGLPSDALAPRTAAEAEAVAADAPRALQGFFRVRLLLKKRLDSFASPSQACVDAVRRGLRVARFAEDYLADWLRVQNKEPPQEQRLFSGGPAQVSINPAFRSAELRTGDVLLMRGPHLLSALIARSGDAEGDFSHLVIIGEDAAGQKHIVESLIQKGVRTEPLDEYLDTTKEGRVVLLRYRDPAVAHRAGRMIFEKAQAAIEAGHRIPYNFRLDRRDNSRLFCAQVIQYAYQLATDNRVFLPRHPSTLAKLKSTPIYAALGMNSLQTFSPSDIQLDPRFDIVAEYHNSKFLRRIRHSNVVMTKLIDWLRGGQSVQSDPFGDFVAGLMLRFVGQGVADSSDLPDQQGVAVMVSVTRIANALVGVVERIDAQAEAERGHPLTFRELLQEVETFRGDTCGTSAGADVVNRLLVASGGACRIAGR